jgi:hypothetical protein
MASVLLSTVLITDLEYLAPNGQWTSCKARDKDADPEFENTVPLKWVDGDGNAIPLITKTTPQVPGATEVGDINFDNFKLNSINNPENYTLFHSYGGGLGNYGNRKTTMIKYKTVCVIVDGGTPFPTKSSDWSYAMIRTSFDVENTLISGSPETSLSSTVNATLNFRFPCFTLAQLGQNAHDSLTSILNNTNNWELILTKQGTGTIKKHNPTSLSLGTPVETSGSYTDFGVAYIPITLGVTFTGVSSGTYTLSAQFKKNDTGDTLNSYLPIPEPFEITVQLTLGTATPTQSVIITGDGEVQISVYIQTGVGS